MLKIFCWTLRKLKWYDNWIGLVEVEKGRLCHFRTRETKKTKFDFGRYFEMMWRTNRVIPLLNKIYSSTLQKFLTMSKIFIGDKNKNYLDLVNILKISFYSRISLLSDKFWGSGLKIAGIWKPGLEIAGPGSKTI